MSGGDGRVRRAGAGSGSLFWPRRKKPIGNFPPPRWFSVTHSQHLQPQSRPPSRWHHCLVASRAAALSPPRCHPSPRGTQSGEGRRGGVPPGSAGEGRQAEPQRARGTATHCARSSRGAARRGRTSNFPAVTKCPCKSPAATRAPRWGGIAPRFCWCGCHPAWHLLPAALPAGENALHVCLLLTASASGSRRGGTGTLPGAQHDSRPSRRRTAPGCFRRPAFPLAGLDREIPARPGTALPTQPKYMNI